MSRAFSTLERGLLRSPDLQVNVLATFFLDGSLGPNLVTNGEFSNGTTGWTATNGAAVSVSNGAAKIQCTGSIYPSLQQIIPVVTGRTYRVNSTVKSGYTGPPLFQVWNTGLGTYVSVDRAAGAYTDTFVALSNSVLINLAVDSGTSGTFAMYDSIEMSEVIGAGAYRFCDEMSGFDLKDGTNTWVGANAFAEASEIRMTSEMQAEQVTLLLDGNRLSQAGVADPARVLSDILGYIYQQRRVDYAFAFRYSYSNQINMIVPAYAGKINSARLIDREMDFPGEGRTRTVTYLEIVLDSLAARYNRATFRLRAHNDQLEIDPTDMFYSFTVDVTMNERTLYWGKKSPFGGGAVTGGSSYGSGGSSGGSGGGSTAGDFSGGGGLGGYVWEHIQNSM
jgi:hypothetical protein